jgi:hypothetical protein
LNRELEMGLTKRDLKAYKSSIKDGRYDITRSKPYSSCEPLLHMVKYDTALVRRLPRMADEIYEIGTQEEQAKLEEILNPLEHLDESSLDILLKAIKDVQEDKEQAK